MMMERRRGEGREEQRRGGGDGQGKGSEGGGLGRKRKATMMSRSRPAANHGRRPVILPAFGNSPKATASCWLALGLCRQADSLPVPVPSLSWTLSLSLSLLEPCTAQRSETRGAVLLAATDGRHAWAEPLTQGTWPV